MSACTAILVFAEADDDARPRIRCAADLADRFAATLIGLAAQPATTPIAHGRMAVFQADWLVAMRDEAEAELRSAERAFHEEIGGRRALWRTRRLDAAEALSEAARNADLIVTNNCVGSDPEDLRGLDLAKLVLNAGRPVLTCPPGSDYLSGKKVLIAWNDSREARRAVVDALPFLHRAEEIQILQITSDASSKAACEGPAEVAAYLASHGIDAEPEVVIEQPEEVGATILEKARWFGADLIVAGAYGHSRLGEMLMGGLTRSLLHQREFFVLFSH